MRLPITVAVVVLLVPASAHAATVGREGTELGLPLIVDLGAGEFYDLDFDRPKSIGRLRGFQCNF